MQAIEPPAHTPDALFEQRQRALERTLESSGLLSDNDENEEERVQRSARRRSRRSRSQSPRAPGADYEEDSSTFSEAASTFAEAKARIEAEAAEQTAGEALAAAEEAAGIACAGPSGEAMEIVLHKESVAPWAATPWEAAALGLTLVNDVSHPRVHLVQEQSIAAGRLQAMDVVTAINGTRVSSDREALELIAAAQCEVRFSVRRGVRPPQLGGQGSRGGPSAETAERAASPCSRRMSFLEAAAQRSADVRDTALRTALETARREAEEERQQRELEAERARRERAEEKHASRLCGRSSPVSSWRVCSSLADNFSTRLMVASALWEEVAAEYAASEPLPESAAPWRQQGVDVMGS